MDIGPLLDALGGVKGRYQLTQLTLQIYSSFVYAFNTFSVVFIGYQPDYECSQITDTSQIQSYYSGNLSEADVEVIYHTCSIDIYANRSGVVTSFAVPCVAGINFTIPRHTSFRTEWDLVCDKAGLTELSQTFIMVGQALGAFTAATLADRFGRKPVYVVSEIGLMTMTIATALSPNIYFLMVCRVITGACQQGVGMSAYTMFMELLPLKWRGLASVMDAVLFSSAAAVLPLFAYIMEGYSWRYLQLVLAATFLYSLFLPCFLDESILWLLNNDRVAEVERILAKACRMNGKNLNDVIMVLRHHVLTSSTTADLDKRHPTVGCEEMDNIITTNDNGETTNSDEEGWTQTAENGLANDENQTENQTKNKTKNEKKNDSKNETNEKNIEKSNKKQKAVQRIQEEHVLDKSLSTQYNVLDLFRYREVLIPLIVICYVWLSDSLYYYGVMLGSADISGDRYLNFALLTLVEIPSSIIAFLLLPRVNRRTMGIWCQLVAGLSLLASVVLAEKGNSDLTLTLANVVTYLGKFALNGAYCVLFVVCVEVFPTTIRSTGMGVASSFSRLAGMGAPYFALLGETIPWAPGVVFGTACVLAGFSMLLLPETRQHPLPNTVQEIREWKSQRTVKLLSLEKMVA